jgi:hypothetical protein
MGQQISDPQFLGPESDEISSVSGPNRKRENNLNKLWIMYEFNRNKKNAFEQKLTHFQSFWPQKLTLWARETII